MTLIDLGGPEGGRYWRVTTGQSADHPDAQSAAVHARVTGSVGATYNDVTVERAEAPVDTYFTVATTGTDHEVKAYLYSHTTVVRTVVDTQRGRRHVLLKTAANLTTDARRLAQYQADRLASGLHGVSPVFDTEDAATAWHQNQWGIDLGSAVRRLNRYNVVVSDAEGNVLFIEQTEVEDANPQQAARLAILDIADQVRGGVL